MQSDESPGQADKMTIDIRHSQKPGVFVAAFNLGMMEGVMILSNHDSALNKYCRESNNGNGSDDDDEEGDSEEEWENMELVRMLEPSPQHRTHASKDPKKKAKTPGVRSRVLTFRLRGRETGEGVIMPCTDIGKLTFDGPSCATFTAEAEISIVSGRTKFTARKIPDTPRIFVESWSDYSEAAYEYARRRRWR